MIHTFSVGPHSVGVHVELLGIDNLSTNWLNCSVLIIYHPAESNCLSSGTSCPYEHPTIYCIYIHLWKKFHLEDDTPYSSFIILCSTFANFKTTTPIHTHKNDKTIFIDNIIAGDCVDSFELHFTFIIMFNSCSFVVMTSNSL